jgi:hypothetical protein
MTIAQQLNITEFPFDIKNEQGKLIYTELSNGYWCKWEFDQDGNLIYTEDSDGYIADNRPKPEPEPLKNQTAVEWLWDVYNQQGMILKAHFYQAKAMDREQIIKSMGIAFNDAIKILEGKESLYKDWEHYYNETYGGDK